MMNSFHTSAYFRIDHHWYKTMTARLTAFNFQELLEFKDFAFTT